MSSTWVNIVKGAEIKWVDVSTAWPPPLSSIVETLRIPFLDGSGDCQMPKLTENEQVTSRISLDVKCSSEIPVGRSP
jgi:hypothetical protein